MSDPRRILFTGISGNGMRAIVPKLAQFVKTPPFERNVCVVEAEGQFCETVRKLGPLPEGATASRAEETILSLALPKPLLRRCWHEAFEKVLDEHSIDSTTRDVFLHAHACFYHQKTREFFTLLDAALMEERFRPNMIITVIDDIENIHSRLREPGQMFDKLSYNYHGLAGIALACQNISTLMHWRAAEFSAAEQLALRLKCKHYLVAAKHPLQTVANLIYGDKLPRIYLSHPIGKPRRNLAAGQTDEFEEFTRELGRICRDLRRQATLFEPTTIDEFRFRTFTGMEDGAKRTFYLPTLTPRWPLAGPPECLFFSPLDADDPNPIDPFGHCSPDAMERFERSKSADATNDPQLETNDPELHKVEAVSALTGALVGEIEDQIAARDLKLVEQCPSSLRNSPNLLR